MIQFPLPYMVSSSSAPSSPFIFLQTLSKILSPSSSSSSVGKYKYNRTNTNSSAGTHWTPTLSRAVSSTLAMSLTLVVLRWVRERIVDQKALRNNDNDNGDNDDNINNRQRQRHSLLYADLRRHLRVWYIQCQWLVQQAATLCHHVFLFKYPARSETIIEPDWTLVTHTGSCQCRAVRFQVCLHSILLRVFLELC